MIPIGSHPALHPLFEGLGYVAGYLVFRRARKRRGDVVGLPERWNVLAGAAVGALVGSRLLGLAEQWPTVQAAWRAGRLSSLLFSPGGKTVVGGLLGAWIGVELVKKLGGIRERTGDHFALPLCVGIAVGRVGCFVAGPADDTYGKPATLPWAVDFGDGIGRHPVQGWVVSRDWSWPEGARFRVFLAGYLGWRLAIDFLKPQPLVVGLNLIQWSCLVGLVFLAVDWVRMRRVSREAIRA
jgi:prolipoprotein diacylglyceryltransferase